MSRVLVVAAHPDDEVLGVGGTILRHVAAGDEVRVHIECCGGLRLRDGRLTAAREVAGEVGYRVTFGESRQLGYEVPNLDPLVAEFEPHVVYSHLPGDINRDHRLVAEGVAVACRPYSAPTVRAVRQFETPSSTEWGAPFVPNLFVDIGRELGRKLEVLHAYGAEMRPLPHPRSEFALRARAQYWGSVSGVRAAEAFATVRETW